MFNLNPQIAAKTMASFALEFFVDAVFMASVHLLLFASLFFLTESCFVRFGFETDINTHDKIIMVGEDQWDCKEFDIILPRRLPQFLAPRLAQSSASIFDLRHWEIIWEIIRLKCMFVIKMVRDFQPITKHSSEVLKKSRLLQASC